MTISKNMRYVAIKLRSLCNRATMQTFPAHFAISILKVVNTTMLKYPCDLSGRVDNAC